MNPSTEDVVANGGCPIEDAPEEDAPEEDTPEEDAPEEDATERWLAWDSPNNEDGDDTEGKKLDGPAEDDGMASK